MNRAGEHCRFCDRKFASEEEVINEAADVDAAPGRLAHRSCFDAQTDEVKAEVRAEREEAREARRKASEESDG